VRRAVLPLAGTEAGRAQLQVGAGGDTTMEVDRAAEDVVFAEMQRLFDSGERFTVLSEEVGLRSFGADYPLVLVDPVDGSLNAKQGVPVFALMMAALAGPSIGDAYAAAVLNLNTGEEWTALSGQGAWRSGQKLGVLKRSEERRIQILGLESTPRALTAVRPLVERSSKIRILGSMALSLALTASGGFDVFCAPVPVRLFDTAASLLLIKETGGVSSDLEGRPLGGLPCTLETRSTVLCAPSPELHAEALAWLRSGK